MSALLSIPPGVIPLQPEAAPQTTPASVPRAHEPSPWSKWQHHLPDQAKPSSWSESTSKVALDDPPFQAEGGVTPP